MKYWLVLVIYSLFLVTYINYAQCCSTSEKEVITGAACSIKDLKKTEQGNDKQLEEKQQNQKRKERKFKDFKSIKK